MRKPSKQRKASLKLLTLEDRTAPAIITVTSLADNTDPGSGVTLREAIQAAETDTSVDGSAAGSGADVIRFAPALFSGGDATIDISLTGDTSAGASAFGITTKINIEGPTGDNGLTLQGGGATSNNRLAYLAPTGDLTLKSLNISGFRHKGGDGGGGALGSGSGGGAAGMGGAIFNNGGTISIANSTLANNTATGGTGADNGSGLGGAIFTRDGSMNLLNSTLANNTALHGGGAAFVVADGRGAVTFIDNSILADSAGGVSDFQAQDLSGGYFISSESSLIETSPLFGTKTDPGLGALADNGGPTLTMAITKTSPAFNAGSNSGASGLTTDQRGQARISGGTVDMGAFEFSATPGGSVVTFQIDDGNIQRSMVRSIKLTLQTPITPADLPTVLANLTLTRVGGGLVGLQLTLDGTGTQVTVKFTGAGIIGGLLADGRYTLSYYGTTVTSLHRLFGDIDGNAEVNALDLTEFNKAMNTRKGLSAKYNQHFDYSQDGVIINSDGTEFGKRKGKKLDVDGLLVSI